MDACTIIAKNYVAHARVLARSPTPGITRAPTFYVLVIDDHEGYLDAAGEPFELVTPGELDIERLRAHGGDLRRARAVHRGQAVAAALDARARGGERRALPRSGHGGARLARARVRRRPLRTGSC